MKCLSPDVSLVSFFKRVSVPEEHKSELLNEAGSINIKQEIVLSFILILVDFILFCIDASVSNLWTRDVHVFGKFSILHQILLIIPVLFLTMVHIFNKFKINNLYILNIPHTFLITGVLTVCALIAAANISVNGRPYAYIIAMYCISPLILLRNYEINAIYTFSYLIYVSGIIRYDLSILDQAPNLIFMAMLVIIASIISRIGYNLYTKSFMYNKIILDKNIELKEMSALLKATFDNIPDIITVKSTEHELLHCNKAASSFLNLSDKEFGQKCYELIGQSTRCVNCHMTEVVADKKPIRAERYINSTWCEVCSYPIMDEYDNVTKVIEQIRDISVQKKNRNGTSTE